MGVSRGFLTFSLLSLGSNVSSSFSRCAATWTNITKIENISWHLLGIYLRNKKRNTFPNDVNI